MTTVAVAFPGNPLRPDTWSGSPSGIARGLAEVGARVRGLDVQPPRPLAALARNAIAAAHLLRAQGPPRARVSAARAAASASPQMSQVWSLCARVRLRGAHDLDGVVQIGTGYLLPPEIPTVTFEDITVVQALEHPYPGWRELPARAVRRRIDLQRHAYERAVACCASTGWAAESIVRDYGIPREKVHVVGVGRNHSPASGAHDWSTPRFLFVGKDWSGKNGDAVLRAFRRLRREVPEARLDVVGEHPPLDEDGVSGHGPLSLADPAQRARAEGLFRAATCFVVPSRFEAAGIVYTEAAAAGLPIIGTTVGGSRELIGDGGVLVDPRDDDALLGAMRELSDPATAERLGALAMRRAELFTWRAVAERLLRALAPPGLGLDALAEFL